MLVFRSLFGLSRARVIVHQTNLRCSLISVPLCLSKKLIYVHLHQLSTFRGGQKSRPKTKEITVNNRKEPSIKAVVGKEIVEILDKTFAKNNRFNFEEWKNIEYSILGLPVDESNIVNRNNVVVTILKYLIQQKNIHPAESFHKYLKEAKLFSWSHKLLIFDLFLTGDDLTDYESLAIPLARESLDEGVHGGVPDIFWKAVSVLSRTSLWTEGLSCALLTPYSPTSVTSAVQAFSDLARRALKEGDTETIWRSLNSPFFHRNIQFLRLENLPHNLELAHNALYKEYIQFCQSLRESGDEEEADKSMRNLFNYFGRQGCFLSLEVEESLRNYYLNSSSSNLEVTRINWQTRICENCGTELSKKEISPGSWKHLKEAILSLMSGRKGEILGSTWPTEVKKLKATVESKGPFDVIVDGLNIQLVRIPNSFRGKGVGSAPKHVWQSNYHSLQLVDTVQYFLDKGLNVAVIHRQREFIKLKHMDRLEAMATCILLDKVTEDDLFLLCGAALSSSSCLLVTNDVLSQHAATIQLTQGEELAKLFTDWQAARQVRVPFFHGYTAKFKKRPGEFFTDPHISLPPTFPLRAIKTGDSWHLPLSRKDRAQPNVQAGLNVPKNWLCITLKENVS